MQPASGHPGQIAVAPPRVTVQPDQVQASPVQDFGRQGAETVVAEVDVHQCGETGQGSRVPSEGVEIKIVELPASLHLEGLQRCQPLEGEGLDLLQGGNVVQDEGPQAAKAVEGIAWQNLQK